jgi:septal ring factor EnvC (AmiA/AmiB activator)
MWEGAIAAVIATITGVAALTTRLNGRINDLDRRVDQMELRIAENYVSKADMESMIDRVETHLIRLENKLDKLTYR